MGFGVDKIDRQSWLVKFRRAKCQDTLDTMRDAAIRNYEGNIRVIADIVLAHEARETEGSVAKIVKLEHAWRRLDGRNDDGFQVAPFPG
ncbi:hypothetical protein CD28_004351 [Salmonella enterica subsp. enterica serovar Typhimurium]|nr:hypothetical protein [Salmonella enterica subsp. enterica serovar Typhimurium]